MPSTLNLLNAEQSPYLLQHALQPVHWHAWNENTLKKAKEENKAIHLSIGYSACHWCHVMAEESFEDEETASLLNQYFINIKVDREERPDLDKIYQTLHQILEQSAGGWPLTVFLTPSLHPLMSGTYFPKEASFGRFSFKQIIEAVAHFYAEKKPQIQAHQAHLQKLLAALRSSAFPFSLQQSLVIKMQEALNKEKDWTEGGFGIAPKFPQAAKLFYLLKRDPTFTCLTLEKMAHNGIQDQIEGGFFRYAVDRAWRIPHFEKMLSDNGQLLFLYTLAAQIQQRSDFADVAKQIAAWSLKSMLAPEGAFYTSLDADLDKEEGKYYRFSLKTVQDSLSSEEYALFAPYFGLDQNANFGSYWHLYQREALAKLSPKLGLEPLKAQQLLSTATIKLKKLRQKQKPPFRDNKILTAWNSLMIKGLFNAGFYLQEERFTNAAIKALDFLQSSLWKEGRLWACFNKGKAYQSAYLDDYAYLIDALVSALKLSWNRAYLSFLRQLVDTVLKYFYDEEAGGFFFTAKDQEEILFRPKIWADEALPSSNGLLVQNLLCLGYLLGEEKYLFVAKNILVAAQAELNAFPSEHSHLMGGLEEYFSPLPLLIIRGSGSALLEWQRLAAAFPFSAHSFSIPNEEVIEPGALALKKPLATTCAYVCIGSRCQEPIENLKDFQAFLESLGPGAS